MRKPKPQKVPEWEDRVEYLASYCNLSKQAFYPYMEMEGFPAKTAKGWRVQSVQTFVAGHAVKEEVIASNDIDYAELKRLDLFERWRKTKLANDLKAGMVVLKSHMDSQLAAQASAVTAHLTGRASRIAPDLAGRTIPEIERIERDYDREILRALSKHVRT